MMRFSEPVIDVEECLVEEVGPGLVKISLFKSWCRLMMLVVEAFLTHT